MADWPKRAPAHDGAKSCKFTAAPLDGHKHVVFKEP